MMSNPSDTVILIVEDDPDNREYVADILGRHYPLRLAENGDECLDTAKRTKPALILLDIMMPGGKDGLQVLALLKQDPATRDIPIIMVTGVNAMTGLAFDKGLLGAYIGEPEAFLEKPVDPELLLATVQRVLDSR